MSNKKKQLWNNRIIGFAEKPAKEFKFNPGNWRIHSDKQRRAINSVLTEIGWVTGVIENVRSGNLIDGHARIEEALKHDPDVLVPYLKVDLSPEEEKKILAVLDPIGDLATPDSEKLQEILDSVQFADDSLADIISNLLPQEIESLVSDEPNLSPNDFEYENKFGVIVECSSEEHQQEVFQNLMEQGYKVKVVVV